MATAVPDSAVPDSAAPADGASAPQRKSFSTSLFVQLVVGIAIGITIGALWPEFGTSSRSVTPSSN